MKTKILLCGACGKMCGNVLSLLSADETATAVCGVDLYPKEIGIPVYKTFAEIKETADVIIAKGQANVETLLDTGHGYNVYYAFLVKCKRFIDRFGREKLTPMLVRDREN